MDSLTSLALIAVAGLALRRISAERAQSRRREIAPGYAAARLRSAADAYARGEIQAAWEEICDPEIDWEYVAACLEARALHAPEAPRFAAMIRDDLAGFRTRLFKAAPAAAAAGLSLLVEATSSATALLAEAEPEDRRPS